MKKKEKKDKMNLVHIVSYQISSLLVRTVMRFGEKAKTCLSSPSHNPKGQRILTVMTALRVA